MVHKAFDAVVKKIDRDDWLTQVIAPLCLLPYSPDDLDLTGRGSWHGCSARIGSAQRSSTKLLGSHVGCQNCRGYLIGHHKDERDGRGSSWLGMRKDCLRAHYLADMSI